MGEILDGRAVAAKVEGEVRERIAALEAMGRRAGLTVLLVGDNPASAIYVNRKRRACERVGITLDVLPLPATISEEEVVVLETRSVAWPTPALGCPDPAKMYAQVVTPGWFIRLAVGVSEYRYHAGKDGEPFTCHPSRAEPALEMSED